MKNKIKDNKKEPSEKMLDELVQDIFVSSIDDKFKNNSDIVMDKIDELNFNLSENIKGVNNKLNSHKKSLDDLKSTNENIQSTLISISLEEEQRNLLLQNNTNNRFDEAYKNIDKLQEDILAENNKIIDKINENDFILIENQKAVLEKIDFLKDHLDACFNKTRKDLINKADGVSSEHNAFFSKELTHLVEILKNRSEEDKHALECHINDGVYLLEDNLLHHLKERDKKIDEIGDQLNKKIEEKLLINTDDFLNFVEESKRERVNILAKIAYNDKNSKNRFLFLNVFLVIQTALIIFLILKQYGLLN